MGGQGENCSIKLIILIRINFRLLFCENVRYFKQVSCKVHKIITLNIINYKYKYNIKNAKESKISKEPLLVAKIPKAS